MVKEEEPEVKEPNVKEPKVKEPKVKEAPVEEEPKEEEAPEVEEPKEEEAPVEEDSDNEDEIQGVPLTKDNAKEGSRVRWSQEILSYLVIFRSSQRRKSTYYLIVEMYLNYHMIRSN